MFLPTALLSLLSFRTVLTLLHCFLFGKAQMRRINTTVHVCGRTGERPGDFHVAPINPNGDHLGSEGNEHYWRMALEHYRALAGAPQFTASFPPSLVSNTGSLCPWTAHIAVLHDVPKRHPSEVASFHHKLLQLPASLLLARGCITRQNLVPVVWTASRGSFQCICIFLVVITMVSHWMEPACGVNNLPEESLQELTLGKIKRKILVFYRRARRIIWGCYSDIYLSLIVFKPTWVVLLAYQPPVAHS